MSLFFLFIHVKRPKLSRKHFRSLESDHRKRDRFWRIDSFCSTSPLGVRNLINYNWSFYLFLFFLCLTLSYFCFDNSFCNSKMCSISSDLLSSPMQQGCMTPFLSNDSVLIYIFLYYIYRQICYYDVTS